MVDCNKELEKVLDERVIGFAKDHSEVKAVTRRFSPDDISEVYYIILDNFDRGLYKYIIDFEEKILNEEGRTIQLSQKKRPSKIDLVEYIYSLPFLGGIICNSNKN
ncbi:MAG: hypothetical protein AABX77_03470 [Nanoarchaeota archaeon]